MNVLLAGLAFVPRQQFLPVLYTYDTLALTYHNLRSLILALSKLIRAVLTPMLLLLVLHKLHNRLFALLGRAAERLEEVFTSNLPVINIFVG